MDTDKKMGWAIRLQFFCIGIMFTCIPWFIVSSCKRNIIKKELIERGIKQYNQQTGELEWVEDSD